MPIESKNLRAALEANAVSRMSPETLQRLDATIKELHKHYARNADEAAESIITTGFLDRKFADSADSVIGYAELCKKGNDKLSDTERAQLAVYYASLYPIFGDLGTDRVASAWIAAEPIRQARTG